MSRTPTQRIRDGSQVPAAQLDRGRSNYEWFEEQHQRDQELAFERRADMPKEKTPTGLVREPLDIDGASAALDDLNVALNEALDDIKQAEGRGQVQQQARATRRAKDAERAPALKGRA